MRLISDVNALRCLDRQFTLNQTCSKSYCHLNQKVCRNGDDDDDDKNDDDDDTNKNNDDNFIKQYPHIAGNIQTWELHKDNT